MRRMVIFVAAVACAFGLSACDLITEYITETQYTTNVSATDTTPWSYSESNKFLAVDSSVLSVKVTGNLGGKTLYYATVNPDSATISSSNLRKVSASAALTTSTASSGPTRPHWALSAEADDTLLAGAGRKHFVGEPLPARATSARSALASPQYATTSAEVAYELGASKYIYVDVDSSVSTYEQRKATLRATGDHCYIWVLENYYTTGTATSPKIDETIAKNFAEQFEKMYPIITYVFGYESDQIYNYDTGTYVDINSLSDTGEKINIVVYDIGGDAVGLRNKNGIVGYFYAKDYYYSAQPRSDMVGKSNVGKYFYIDSAYAVTDFEDTLSTLAHEFQHMINFNQKDILHDISPDTAYNEMLSMLCEDMMQKKLGLTDEGLSDEDSPKNRLQQFNAYYYVSGIREYLTTNSVYSYATSYAFGAWLCRQYGGAALIQQMSKNAYVDNDSILAAVKAVNPSAANYTFADLFQQFVRALFGDTTYTMNKNASQTLTYASGSTTYSYPMTAIDLTDTAYSLKGTTVETNMKDKVYSGYDFNGPLLIGNDYNADLHPAYGVQLHGVGTYSSGTTSDTITFSASGAEKLKIYLIIQ